MFVSCMHVFACKPIHFMASPLLVLPSLLSISCQIGFVNGNPSRSQSEIRSKKPLWKSGSSSAVNLLTDRTLWMSLCSTTQITVIASLGQPRFRSNAILYLVSPRSLKIRLIFGNDLRHHCLRCGHGPNATSYHPSESPWPKTE